MSGRRGETLGEDLQIFLGDLCKGGGFCSALAADIIRDCETLTAEAFATAVLVAEGWPEPEREYHWKPQFMKLFIERYGHAVSVADFNRV